MNKFLSLHRGVLANECREDGLDAVLNFGVGQCALRGLERQPDREAYRARRDAFPWYRSKKLSAVKGACRSRPAA